MTTAIGMVDYGMGNRRSVEKALLRTGATVHVTADHDLLRSVDGLYVPGVGAFPAAMAALRERGLDGLLRERAADGVPVMGSCLGMQLLFERSEEHGGEEGLGLLPGSVVRLDARGLKLPHIGWNEVRWAQETPLAEGLPDPVALYHVHSFIPRVEEDLVLGFGEYGTRFPSIVGRDRVWGAQCHPEKSSGEGLALLRNFVAQCAGVAA
ncbi:imidazole glycerol phosphate synthase subunit HisH [Conexibacter sp. SYSU D00693]|uniref:imidazole glycerol phosphate synthase subunit HisH n=1 Tax=Conexibacter sp. SYSU D00693 TaxID=2812560 RepID=UPI00196BA6F5|nr:imidazole glycerol phosphate synthase subunit HisH [Conexibacter sp. SYSU D00693]